MDTKHLTQEDDDILYELWGDNDFFLEDIDEAIKLAKEKYLNISEKEISNLFYNFLADNDDNDIEYESEDQERT